VVLDRVEVPGQGGQAPLVGGRADRAGVRVHLQPVEHVGVEDAGLGDGGEGQREHHLLLVGGVAGVPEHVVDVGRAHVDVGEDAVDRVRIVVVGHAVPLVDGRS